MLMQASSPSCVAIDAGFLHSLDDEPGPRPTSDLEARRRRPDSPLIPDHHEPPRRPMLALTSLAGWEDAVLASVAGATGTPDERDAQIERSGLYGEYPAIVNAYIEHFGDADSGMEALKRAYFLVWRGAMATPADSGIASLPDGTIRLVIDEIDAWARRGATDAELRWMLGHYHAVGPSVLELYGASAPLIRLASDVGGDAWHDAGIDRAAMAGRGQLGRYWTALIDRR